MPIQWYPGHMAKAKRQLAESLRLIDLVVELAVARAPEASRNPDFEDLFSGKARVVLLNKGDLADPAATKRWIEHYRRQGVYAAALVSSGAGAGVKKVALPLLSRAAEPKVAAYRQRGVTKVVRALVAGVPNVGKSTFINRIAGDSRAKTGDKPGVTRANQWVKITPYMELMDTPGLLWPKLENQEYARHLAYIGCISDEIMDAEKLATMLLLDLLRLAPAAVTARYRLATAETPAADLLGAVAKSRGFLLRGGECDTERAARIVLDEYRAGKIARVTLEEPQEAARTPSPDAPESAAGTDA